MASRPSSTLVDCIVSALHDVDLMVNADPSNRFTADYFKRLRMRLTNLKIFAFSARKMGDDADFSSFLLRIEDTVRQYAEQIHPLCLDLTDPTTDLHSSMAFDFRKAIESLEEEIQQCYLTIFEFADRHQSARLATDEILQIISSILENLLDFDCLRWTLFRFEDFKEAMEALGEQMTFLKNLVRFAITRSAEPAEGLLIHTEAASIYGAYLIFMCRLLEKLDEENLERIHLEILEFTQKMKPVDPQVCDIYTQVLHNSKLSTQLLDPTQDMDDEAFNAMQNFMDSLVSDLWKMLQRNTSSSVFMKDQLQEVYKGLESLGTTLKQKPNNTIGMEIKKNIGALICDAGVLICSLYQIQTEQELGLQSLLETIKLTLAAFGEDDSQVEVFNFPKTNGLGFVDFLLGKLMELKNCQVESTAASQLQTLTDDLVSFGSFMGDIVDLRHQHEELQTWWDRALEMAYRVEDLIDHLLVGDLPDSFPIQFDSIMKGIKDIQATIKDKRQEIRVKEVTKSYNQETTQRTPSLTNEVVGFENDARSVLDRLKRGLTKQLRVVSIVGMPGLGKTTLATKIYNDPSVFYHFSVRAWSPISQVVDKKKVFLDLLSQIDSSKCSDLTPDMNGHDLAEKLWRSLKGKTYLIFLDDIWGVEAWNDLREAFPDDNVGSRIIVTSRNHDAIPGNILDKEPHSLCPLNKEESFKLLQSKLSPENGWTPSLRTIGMQIAEICNGLPLTITIVAGLLATMEQEGWKRVLDDLTSGIASVTEHCKKTLELSYDYLPDDLKPCLLYFGAFREDDEIIVRRLIRLWIAEGFVRKAEGKSLEDAAEEYLLDLIDRSLIVVAKRRSDGGIKACRIHDLLHDFCLQKAKDEHFFHILKGNDEHLAPGEQRSVRRLCIHSTAEHFKESKLFCPCVRSLLFNSTQGTQMLSNISFVIHIFNLLRVLDLEQIHLSGFPTEIEMLVQLAFLDIRGEIKHIPPSIAKLSKLETLIVNPDRGTLSLPDSLWTLRKLKYLYIRSSISPDDSGAILPIENLHGSFVLTELDRLSGVIIPYWGIMERLMRKFPNIRRLRCPLFQCKDNPENLDKIVVPEFLSQLQSLHMSTSLGGFSRHSTFEFSLPANLKKLSLVQFDLSRRNMSIIGELPNLEILKLLFVSFEGNTWEMDEGEFSNLRILKLYSWKLSKWTSCDDQFDCLEKLVLYQCHDLKEMPSCLNSISTLEMIEVIRCTDNVNKLVRQIEEEQMMWGNEGLKIKIQSYA